jgi:hypothetical protein
MNSSHRVAALTFKLGNISAVLSLWTSALPTGRFMVSPAAIGAGDAPMTSKLKLPLVA